jgi:hypothetical protein
MSACAKELFGTKLISEEMVHFVYREGERCCDMTLFLGSDYHVFRHSPIASVSPSKLDHSWNKRFELRQANFKNKKG